MMNKTSITESIKDIENLEDLKQFLLNRSTLLNFIVLAEKVYGLR